MEEYLSSIHFLPCPWQLNISSVFLSFTPLALHVWLDFAYFPGIFCFHLQPHHSWYLLLYLYFFCHSEALIGCSPDDVQLKIYILELKWFLSMIFANSPLCLNLSEWVKQPTTEQSCEQRRPSHPSTDLPMWAQILLSKHKSSHPSTNLPIWAQIFPSEHKSSHPSKIFPSKHKSSHPSTNVGQSSARIWK